MKLWWEPTDPLTGHAGAHNATTNAIYALLIWCGVLTLGLLAVVVGVFL